MFVTEIVAAYNLADVFDTIVISAVEGTDDKTRLCEFALDASASTATAARPCSSTTEEISSMHGATPVVPDTGSEATASSSTISWRWSAESSIRRRRAARALRREVLDSCCDGLVFDGVLFALFGRDGWWRVAGFAVAEVVAVAVVEVEASVGVAFDGHAAFV